MGTSGVENNSEQKALLRYHEKLDAFRDTIGQYYAEKTIDVYRTVKTNPPTDDDLIPQRYRGKTEMEVKELLIEYTDEEIAEFSDSEKRQEVAHDAISINKTPEKCVNEAVRSYRGVKRKYSSVMAEEYKYSRGPYVARLHISPEYGLVTKFDKKGHANLLLKQNVHIVDIWDKEFPLIEIDYDAEPDDNKE